MAALFADLPGADREHGRARQALQSRTAASARISCPRFRCPASTRSTASSASSAREGLVDAPRQASRRPRASRARTTTQRLEIELDVIVQMGFPGYFLIVADFINWAKQHDIPVGPGRGSGAGSLVAYALGITDLDPLRYDLLFERFLNPERVSMPDFDVDFCMDRRDEVIDYVADKYGRDRVSQIITYGTMAAKAVLRDTGRVLGMPYGQVDRIAKLIAEDAARSVARGRARPLASKSRKEPDRVVAEFKALYATDEEVTRARRSRAASSKTSRATPASTPAASSSRRRRCSDYAPLFSEGGGDGARHAVRQGRRRSGRPGQVRLPRPAHADDHRLGGQGDQRAARDATAKRRSTSPRCRLDERRRYALLEALRRPPRCSSSNRAACAICSRSCSPTRSRTSSRWSRCSARARCIGHGRRLHRAQARPRRGQLSASRARADPEADLRRHRLPGTGDADRAGARRLFARRRRPAAPRDGQEESPRRWRKQRVKFEDGAANNGDRAAHRERDLRPDGEVRRVRLQQVALGRLRAGRLPDRVAEGALPGRVHGRGAVRRTWTTPTRSSTSSAKRARWVSPCCRRTSTRRTTCSRRATTQTIRYGLGAVKGVGRGAVEAIVEARARGGAFRDLPISAGASMRTKINKRVLEALILSGSMDALATNRASLMAQLPEAMRAAEQHAREREAGQNDMFGAAMRRRCRHRASNCPKRRRMADRTQQLAGERETLGHYLSGHPTDRWRRTDRARRPRRSARSTSTTSARAAERTARLRQDDAGGASPAWSSRSASAATARRSCRSRTVSGSIEVRFFREAWVEFGPLLTRDAILVFEGGLRDDEFSGGFSCARAASADDRIRCANASARVLRLRLNARARRFHGAPAAGARRAPRRQRRRCASQSATPAAQAEIELGAEWRVRAAPALPRAAAQRSPGVRGARLRVRPAPGGAELTAAPT